MSEFDFPIDQNTRRRLNFGQVCRKFTKGLDCPECNKALELFKKAESSPSKVEGEKYRNAAQLLYSKSKVFLNGIDVDDEDKSYPVKIFALAPSTYDDIITQVKGMKYIQSNFNLVHPQIGHNVLITRTGTGRNTRYAVQIDQRETVLPNSEVLAKLLGHDFSPLFDLDVLEEFIMQNYANITTPSKALNVIRFLPPMQGKKAVYRELRFHRFTVDSYKNFITGSDSILGSGSTGIEGSKIPASDDEFDPFALVPDPARGTIPEVVSSPKPVEVAPISSLNMASIDAQIKELLLKKQAQQ
jgi:hypothetical protein